MSSPFFSRINISTWMLWALLPLGLYGFLSFVIFMLIFAVDEEPGAFASVAFGFLGIFITWPLWWLCLIIGLVLRFMVRREEERVQEDAQEYAELHRWQGVSRTQWRSIKSSGVILTVTKARRSTNYLLTAEVDGKGVGTDRFESPLYAMQFGDHLWDNLLSEQEEVDSEKVRQFRTMWERARGVGR